MLVLVSTCFSGKLCLHVCTSGYRDLLARGAAVGLCLGKLFRALARPMSLQPEDLPSHENEQYHWLQGLWEEWEKDRQIKDLARAGRCLMSGLRRKLDNQEVVVGTLKCAALNVPILSTVVSRMATNGILKNPPLGRLYCEFLSFHQQWNPRPGQELPPIAHADAWGAKRLLTFLKRKWSRTEMPRDPYLQFKLQSLKSCFCDPQPFNSTLHWVVLGPKLESHRPELPSGI